MIYYISIDSVAQEDPSLKGHSVNYSEDILQFVHQ